MGGIKTNSSDKNTPKNGFIISTSILLRAISQNKEIEKFTNVTMCGIQLCMTLLLNSKEFFQQIRKMRKYVYKTKARGRMTVVVVINIPTRLLSIVLIQANFTTGQLAQNTLGILLPHNGSLPARYTQAPTEKMGKIHAKATNLEIIFEVILL